MTFDAWFKSLNQNGRETYFLGQEGAISKEAWNYQQDKIDSIVNLIDKYQYSSVDRILKEVKELLK